MGQEIFVTRPSLPPFEEYAAMLRPLWESRWLTNMGTYHDQLERELKDYLQVPELSLFCNGHLALEGALQIAGLSGEVITTPYTFASTVHAIVRQGLTPVLCDVKPEDGTLDETQLESLITERTSAIVPVHVYGHCCNVEAIDSIAKKHGLKVIYDAAHAFGVTLGGRGIGTFGDMSMFSFHATKIFNTVEGGAVAFHDPAPRAKLRAVKNFGIQDEETITEIGGNAKLNELQAIMGLCNLRYVDRDIARSRVLSERYHERFSCVSGIRFFTPRSDAAPNYAYMPVCIEPETFGADRDAVQAALREHGVYLRKYFYPIVSEYACYRRRFAGCCLPQAERLSRQVLTLPIYADLELQDVDRICDLILQVVH